MCEIPTASTHVHTTQTSKQLQLINQFSEVSGYTITIQKLFAFLHNNHKVSKIWKIIPFVITSKIIKYLELNIIKERYTGKYKT